MEIKKIAFKYVETYFKLLKALRVSENEMPDLETEKEKIEAYKKYFDGIKRLRELESEVIGFLNLL